jgi:hypothetical protein
MFYHPRVIRTFITAPFFVVIIITPLMMIKRERYSAHEKPFFFFFFFNSKRRRYSALKLCLTTEERRTHFENVFLQILGLETLKLFFSLFWRKHADARSSQFQHLTMPISSPSLSALKHMPNNLLQDNTNNTTTNGVTLMKQTGGGVPSKRDSPFCCF